MKLITPEARGVWRLRTTLVKKAVRSGDNRLFIPSFDTGKTYIGQFIAVGIRVENSKDNWRNGGYLSQEFKFTSNGYTHNNKAFNRTQDLLINDVTILNLPLLTDDEYQLRYFPPTYFSDVRLQIWEYIGVQTDALIRDIANFFSKASPSLLVNLPEVNRKLDLLLDKQTICTGVDLSAIEAKIDLLLSKCNRQPQPRNYFAAKRIHHYYFGNLL